MVNMRPRDDLKLSATQLKKIPLKEIPKYSYLPQYSLDSSSSLPQAFPEFYRKTTCNALKT